MNYNLPWVEKYRPTKLSEIIGQEKIIYSLTKIIDGNSFPHLLFYGGSGSGKTSTIMSILNDYFGKKRKLMVMKLDASDDRGINSVREEIKGFAEKKNYFNKGIKVIILDEADSMTFDAQFALRRIIEKYSKNTRFCLICNYDNKIIPAIKSRCSEFKFNPIKKEIMRDHLIKISILENLDYTDEKLDIVCNISKGDMRKAINILQSSIVYEKDKKYLDINLCYSISGYPKHNEIIDIIKILFDPSIKLEKSINKVSNIVIKNGYSVSVILKELLDFIVLKIKDNEIEPDEYAKIFSEMANLQSYVSKSTFGDIYLSMLVSLFKNNDKKIDIKKTNK